MNFRDLMFPYEVKKLPKSFDDWREDFINLISQKCLAYQHKTDISGISDSNFERELKIIPRNIVRLTRQMCSCNKNCIEYSLYYTKFNEACKFFDLNNYLEDESYYKSFVIDKKVIYDRLEDLDTFVDLSALSHEIEINIKDLCDNKSESLRRLKCKVYELKDFCNANQTCSDIILNKKPTRYYDNRKLYYNKCKNSNFRNELNNLEKKFLLPPIYSESRLKREINEPVENSTLKLNGRNLSVVFPVLLILIYFSKRGIWSFKLLTILLCCVAGFFYGIIN